MSVKETHFNVKRRLGFLSSKLGYNCCVVSMASPILPANTNFWIPIYKKGAKINLLRVETYSRLSTKKTW